MLLLLHSLPSTIADYITSTYLFSTYPYTLRYKLQIIFSPNNESRKSATSFLLLLPPTSVTVPLYL